MRQSGGVDQVRQDLRTGELRVEEVPLPALRPGGLLVANAFSVLSPGTERSTIAASRLGWIGKARARPDLARKVYRVARSHGLLEAWRLAKARLETPVPLGYSCAGVVAAVGEGVSGFRTGDRVACAGAGYASHAGVVFVPRNLAVRVPDGVALDEAAYATLGAIALQAVRQSGAALGDRAAVLGLGVVGLLAVQLLRAAGCRVFGVDLEPERVEAALRHGAEAAVVRDGDVEGAAGAMTQGWGMDRVLVCTSGGGADPLALAGALCREKGVVVAVGDGKLELPREPYYRKEIELRLSRSTGPGRHDPEYEEHGRDYPLPYVRWTENRNLAAFLDLVRDGRVEVAPLSTHRFPVARAAEAYALVTGERAASALGVVLEYGAPPPPPPSPASRLPAPRATPGISLVGAGAFAQGFLLPHLSGERRVVVTATGLRAAHARKRHGFLEASTDPARALEDAGTGAVFIATRNDSHAALAARALDAGKAVFVEKPLAITPAQLEEVERAVARAGPGRLMVGFNRRFAPCGVFLKELFARRSGPLLLHYRVHAGPLPRGHWILDPEVGGGRLLAEVCHFVDFVLFLCGERARRVTAAGDLALLLETEGGSAATIAYGAGPEGGMGKELLEAFCEGVAARLDDFRAVTVLGGRRPRRFGGRKQDKGHRAEVEAFLGAVRSGRPVPVPETESIHATRVTLAAAESLRTGETVLLDG